MVCQNVIVHLIDYLYFLTDWFMSKVYNFVMLYDPCLKIFFCWFQWSMRVHCSTLVFKPWMSSILLNNPSMHLYFAQAFLSCQFSVQTACLKIMSVWSPFKTLFARQTIIMTSIWGRSAVREQKEEWTSISQLWRSWVLDKLAKKEMLESACQATEELRWLSQETMMMIFVGRASFGGERQWNIFRDKAAHRNSTHLFLLPHLFFSPLSFFVLPPRPERCSHIPSRYVGLLSPPHPQPQDSAEWT